MYEATADDVRQGLLNLLVCCLGIFVEQRLGGEDHAAQAEAALRGSFIDKRLLNGMRLFGSSQAFESGDFLLLNGADGSYAGADGLALDEYRTGSALAQAATELRSAQLQVVAEHIKQWAVGIDID